LETNRRTRIPRWLGRENEEYVARTRNCCGWPSSPPLPVSKLKKKTFKINKKNKKMKYLKNCEIKENHRKMINQKNERNNK